MRLRIYICILLGALSTQAKEPAFCQPANFMAHKVPSAPGLERGSTFQIGQLKLVGLAVGYSQINDVLRASSAPPEAGYCTWYFGDRYPEGQKQQLVSRRLPIPNRNLDYTVEAYSKILDSSFAGRTVRGSIPECVTQQKYLAMGCDGMAHRGPSVFAMFLAYVGCSPENSVAIVNQIWGANGIKPEMRLALARHAQEFGEAHRFERVQLLTVMSERQK